MHEIVPIFKALADETRLRILAILLEQGELCVCEIIAALGLPQSTISRHLAYLKKTGWVVDRRSGLWSHYSLHQGTQLTKDVRELLKRHIHLSPADGKRLAAFRQVERCRDES